MHIFPTYLIHFYEPVGITNQMDLENLKWSLRLRNVILEEREIKGCALNLILSQGRREALLLLFTFP